MHLYIFRRIRYNWCMRCRLGLWNIWHICESRSHFKLKNDHHILFDFCWHDWLSLAIPWSASRVFASECYQHSARLQHKHLQLYRMMLYLRIILRHICQDQTYGSVNSLWPNSATWHHITELGKPFCRQLRVSWRHHIVTPTKVDLIIGIHLRWISQKMHKICWQNII